MLIDFKGFSFDPSTSTLEVWGTCPSSGWSVVLHQVVFVQAPTWYPVEVIGTAPAGVSLPSVTPFSVKQAVNVGTTGGIEVIGATMSVQTK
jgi:hypothetical protein